MQNFHLKILLLTVLVVSQPPRVCLSQSAIPSWEAKYGKKTVDFTPDDWKSVIDVRWGQGLSTDRKLALFDEWWNAVDRQFGGFEGLDFDIDVFRARVRPEIAGGVSRGRFAAIMNHFGYGLADLHTYIWDTPVRNSPRVKGTPVLVVGQYGTNRQFGAVLSMLPDSTLAVYRTMDNHPLGLERGDLVLGYDGVAWKDIYPKLIEAELPLFLNVTNAGPEEANEYYLMQSAGLNWHLFDTIDIQKHETGDIQHINTSVLANVNTTMWGTDRLFVPGVEWPNRSNNVRVAWGIISGTNIGMVTVTSWSFDAIYDIRARFEQAIQEFVAADVDGIIIDQRFNTGGGSLARDGWSILFNETLFTVGFRQRDLGVEGDRLALEEDPLRQAVNLRIFGNPSTYFDKPIAGLIGPGAISAGELESLRLRFHPRARLFGRPTAGGNSGSIFLNLQEPDWFASLTIGPVYLVSSGINLLRVSVEPDFPVWLTHEDIIKNEDTVVKAAVEWIQNGGPPPVGVEMPQIHAERQDNFPIDVYPNPFLENISVSVPNGTSGPLTLELYDLLGRKVARTTHHGLPPVRFSMANFPALSRLPSGPYVYRISSGSQEATGLIVRQ